MKVRLNNSVAGFYKKLLLILMMLPIPVIGSAASGTVPQIGPVRLEFILFGLVLLGVALFHKSTFQVAVTGVVVILIFKLIFDSDFRLGQHFFGETPFIDQILDKSLRSGEWGILINLLGLLLGFSVLSKIFEESGVPDILPRYLPNDWKGPLLLLVFVFILSSFLDNIAAALIGGTIALVVFKNKVLISPFLQIII